MSKANGTSVSRKYMTDTGVELEFRVVSGWTISEINRKWEGCKPLPPKIQTEIGLDENPNDSQYKKELKLWTLNQAAEINETLIRIGILTQPPDEFMALYQEEFPDIDRRNVKIHWVYTLLGDKAEEFFEVLLGQNNVTEKGLAESAATFPRND